MSSDTLQLNSVDLVSSVRTVPQNGAPVSADYNETQRENLVDLASLAGVINNLLIPYFTALKATSAGNPPNTPVIGIEGRTVISDSSNQADIFYDAVSSTPLDIATSMTMLRAMITLLQTEMTNLDIAVQGVQSRVSSAGITNLTNVVQQLRTLYNSLNAIVSGHTIELQRLSGFQEVRETSVGIPPGSSLQTTVLWPVAYPDVNYTVALSLETGYATLQILSFTKLDDGTGIQVLIQNTDVSNTLTGTIHAQAQHDV